MTVSLELPCGCVITCCDVLSMCLEHAVAYQRKRVEAAQARREFEERWRAVSKPAQGVSHETD